MRGPRDTSSGWITYELVRVDKHGNVVARPFSDALASSGRLPLQATTRMAIVEELGWPAAQMLRYGKKGKKRIVKKDDAIYLLKCAPHCWRLYFYVRPESKGFVYVHAVCKKQDAEDAADTTVARKRFDQRADGALERIYFELTKGY